jgi:hypothetical protein
VATCSECILKGNEILFSGMPHQKAVLTGYIDISGQIGVEFSM